MELADGAAAGIFLRIQLGSELDRVRALRLAAGGIARTQPAQAWAPSHHSLIAENRIAELKHVLAADAFCLHQFFATEAAFRSILLLFNLLGEFERACRFPSYRQTATLRA